MVYARLLSATPTEAVRASKAHHPEFYRAEGKLLHLGMTEEDADDDGVSGGIVHTRTHAHVCSCS